MSRISQVGTYTRTSVAAPLRGFCPVQAALRLTDIKIDQLVQNGKKLVLLDVDNTITHWRSEDLAEEVLGWVNAAQQLGLELALVSNTRHPERLKRLAARLNVTAYTGRFKPSRDMFLRALKDFNRTASETIMIGDQLFTDVLGANRSGIEAVWVCPLDKKEFIGTKVNRWFERRIEAVLYNALTVPGEITPVDQAGAQSVSTVDRPVFQQFLKFCVVGGSSFAIDTGLAVYLNAKMKLNGELMSIHLGRYLISHFSVVSHYSQDPFIAAGLVIFPLSGLVAMANSFYWNRRWTFGIKSDDHVKRQITRFVIISLIGVVLNSLISNIMVPLLPGSESRRTLFAKAVAAVFVAIWNFGGQRLYAFKSE